MAALTRVRRRHSERGAVLVEAAIAVPLLLLIVLGIIDFGRLFQRYEVVTNAAREGARVAVLPGYTNAVGPDGDVQKRVRQYLTAAGLDPSLAVPTPYPPTPVRVGGVGGPCITLTGVTVTYPHTFSFVGGIMSFFGGSGWGTQQLNATATMRTEGAALTCP